MRVAGPSATVLEDGREREARLPSGRGRGRLVAGDRVRVREVGDEVLVSAVEPRRTVLERADGHSRRPRPVVANADLVLVVASVVDPRVRPDTIDRYLVAAIVGGLDAAIAFTKMDLPHEERELRALGERYRAIGHRVLAGDAREGSFVAEVGRLIDARVAALVGPSGVGKSTLARALTGVDRAVGSVSEKAGTGRHTTTDPRLIPLPGGGGIVDTAGVRSFHLPELEQADVVAGFPEITAAASGCRFRDCKHVGEDGCAVPARVSPERLDSYRRVLDEVGALTSRASRA